MHPLGNAIAGFSAVVGSWTRFILVAHAECAAPHCPQPPAGGAPLPEENFGIQPTSVISAAESGPSGGSSSAVVTSEAGASARGAGGGGRAIDQMLSVIFAGVGSGQRRAAILSSPSGDAACAAASCTER
jgi:hypothetical protein